MAAVIIFAILMFGFLITIHEFGHYIFARIFKVGIEEFSIGMGPKIFSKRSKKTDILYSLRLLPIGGYVNMVGEDENFDDDRAINKKSPWKRLIILAAGGFFNIVAGVILSAAFVLLSLNSLGSTQIADFNENSVSSYYLEQNDIITHINGKKVGISDDLLFRVMWESKTPETVEITTETGEKVTLENVALLEVTVIRDGEKLVLKDVPFKMTVSEGVGVGDADFRVYAESDRSFSTVVKHIYYSTKTNIDQVWASLGGLITGRVGLSSVSGPVGVTEQMGEVASFGFKYLIYFAAVIAINLGIFNLLPVPALDGGRIVFIIIEMIRGKPVDPKVEAKIHSTALLILLALVVVIMIKDVVGLF